MDNKKALGRAGETAAAAFLEGRGVRIIARNFNCRQGEIDIIGLVREGALHYLVAFEVKTRRRGSAERPAVAVTYRKQYRISKTLEYFRYLHSIPGDMGIRYDVIEVDDSFCCNWIRDAFDHPAYR